MPSRRRSATQRKVSVRSTPPQYPGHYLTVGDTDRASIRLIQQRLNTVGCGPLDINGIFNKQTKAAVQLFQARSVDSQGQSLKIDGVVGPLTWATLFGSASLPGTIGEAVSPLIRSSLVVAATQIGVMEQPPGSNRGPQVDEYLKSVGLDPEDDSYPWCAAFVYWTFHKAAAQVGVENPCVRTAGVLDHWNRAGRAGITRVLPGDIQDDFSLLKPGFIFVISMDSGKGHMGIVEDFRDDRLVTIEGNTNLPGDRDGGGVFRRHARKLSDINKGFISYDA
ncbi:MAG: CHAP domain-containing protein [Nitrospira sp.]